MRVQSDNLIWFEYKRIYSIRITASTHSCTVVSGYLLHVSWYLSKIHFLVKLQSFAFLRWKLWVVDS